MKFEPDALPDTNSHGSQTDVIIIMADSLRADHMGLYGYPRDTTPFLDGLKKTGHLKQVRYAYASGSSTVPGVVTTLSSRELDGFSDIRESLPDALRRHGYQSNFILSGDHRGQRDLYAKKIDRLFDEGDDSRYVYGDDKFVLDRLNELLPVAPDLPQFYYLHLMSSHELGKLEGGFRRFRPFVLPWWSRFFEDKAMNAYWINQYDNRVLQADSVMAAIFGLFRRLGEHSHKRIFVILADHGESLFEHGRAGHGWSFYDENLHIPLIIYDEGPRPYKNLEFASQMDVAPTLFARLGLPAPAAWQGDSLFAPPRNRSIVSQVLNDNRSWMAVTQFQDGRRLRLVKKKRHYVASRSEEFYDLDLDPGEKHDLAHAGDGRMNALHERAHEVLEREGVPDISEGPDSGP